MQSDTILFRLEQLAKERNVEVLYACESGSRAWGIESPDSDYDVRFIYRHDPLWYRTLDEGRDVIEFTDGLLDFSGWDIRKALRLAGKSNPALLEWLHSPIVYKTVDRIEPLKDIMETFSAKALMHHYVSLAYRQNKAYWKDNEPVRLKKYFYAVRPLMAVQWMYTYDYNMPPIRFDELREDVELVEQVSKQLDMLLDLKSKTGELEGTGRFPALDGYINGMMEAGHSCADQATDAKPSQKLLNLLFRDLTN